MVIKEGCSGAATLNVIVLDSEMIEVLIFVAIELMSKLRCFKKCAVSMCGGSLPIHMCGARSACMHPCMYTDQDGKHADLISPLSIKGSKNGIVEEMA